MTVDRFVQCQRCGRVYQLPTTPFDLQAVLPKQGKQHFCCATFKPTYDQVRPCESQEFREITVTKARAWRGPLRFVVPEWYQPEYDTLLARGGAASTSGR